MEVVSGPGSSSRSRTAGPETLPELVEMLREDYRANGPRAAVSPGFHALLVYRFGRWLRLAPLPRLVRVPLHAVYLFLAYVVQTAHGIELYPAARVGRRLRIWHRGAVVNGSAEIGDDCILRQYVTIGAVHEGGPCPRLGNGVELGPGVVVVGDVTIGDGALLGPNAVVTFDVPAGGRIVASPARNVAVASSTRVDAGSSPRGPSPVQVAALVMELVGLDDAPSEDEPLISSGLVDSLNLARLVEALEDAYGVPIPLESLGADAFDTAADIASYLGTQQG
jgi:serine O-acetyltransferase